MKSISKILFAVLALVAVVGLTSCNKDKKNEKKLVGSWKAMSVHSREYVNGELRDETTDDVTGENTVYTFEKGDKITMTDGSSTATGTYSVSGDQLTISGSANGLPFSNTGKFDLNGNTLKYSISETYSFEDSTYKSDMDITFNKQ